MTIQIVDRKTGTTSPEIVLGGNLVKWVYQTYSGRAVRRALLTNRWFSAAYGLYQDSAASTNGIPGVIQQLGIDMREFEVPEGGYKSFNDFFTRRLRPGARPVEEAPERLASPADGRILVYPELKGDSAIPVKGAVISAYELLGRSDAAARYRNGSLCVVRLCPADYHRFHFPCDGHATAPQTLRGPLESVNPEALWRGRPILDTNQRDLTYIDSERFGRVAYLEVGAMCVGTIAHGYRPGAVTKGQEKGLFQFGGSTVVMVFEPGRVRFDEDLVKHSAEGLECFVKMGEGIATAPGAALGSPSGGVHNAIPAATAKLRWPLTMALWVIALGRCRGAVYSAASERAPGARIMSCTRVSIT